MKTLRFVGLLAFATLWLASLAFAQAPVITGVGVVDPACFYKVGVSTKLCSIAPGTTLNINGSNFGPPGGVVALCDCADATVVHWSSTRITVIVNAVNPGSSLFLETYGGLFSNNIPYTALGPVITSIVVATAPTFPTRARSSA